VTEPICLLQNTQQLDEGTTVTDGSRLQNDMSDILHSGVTDGDAESDGVILNSPTLRLLCDVGHAIFSGSDGTVVPQKDGPKCNSNDNIFNQSNSPQMLAPQINITRCNYSDMGHGTFGAAYGAVALDSTECNHSDNMFNQSNNLQVVFPQTNSTKCKFNDIIINQSNSPQVLVPQIHSCNSNDNTFNQSSSLRTCDGQAIVRMPGMSSDILRTPIPQSTQTHPRG